MAAYELRGQADLVMDVMKIGGVLVVGTACISFAAWSLIHRKASSLGRGALAGLMTSMMVIPLPNFLAAFKTAFLENVRTGEVGYLVSALEAAVPAAITGLLTFQVLTKVSLVAMIACLCLGVIIVWGVPSQQRET